MNAARVLLIVGTVLALAAAVGFVLTVFFGLEL